MKSLSCLLLLAGFVFACKPTGSLPLHREWHLVELKNKHVPANVHATLKFESAGKRYSGNNSCNAYSGTCQMDNSTLKFGPAIATKMYCAEVADWEAAFMNMLPTVDFYVQRDGQLRLFAGTKIVAIFE